MLWQIRRMENEECGKCGVWKMRRVVNAEGGKNASIITRIMHSYFFLALTNVSKKVNQRIKRVQHYCPCSLIIAFSLLNTYFVATWYSTK